MVKFILDDVLDFSLDISSISDMDYSAELSLLVKFIYGNSSIQYEDKIWFDIQNVKDFIFNLNNDKICMLCNIDEDFLLQIEDTVLTIKINKTYFTDKPIKLEFKNDVKNELYKIKQAFRDIDYL